MTLAYLYMTFWQARQVSRGIGNLSWGLAVIAGKGARKLLRPIVLGICWRRKPIPSEVT